MRILHHRPTRRLRRPSRRLQLRPEVPSQLDRPVVACLHCGSLDEVGRMVEKLRAAQSVARQRTANAARRSRPSAA